MTDETQIHQETASDIESSETVFSRDDWKPGTIDRSRGAEVLTTGDVLFGAYEITGKLGEGGMGAVFSARHISLGSLRAIKVMNATLSLNLDAVERFHREAKALLDVHHPAVVRCHDLLRDESGSIFLVMELIEGIPLSDRMKQSPLNEEELRQLALRLGAGLAAAHAQGVIHRDIAPDNVVLPEGRADRAKLVDFGIAKVLRVGEETMTAGFKGKLAFASPEQLGFYDSEIGPASDFFSLGLLLCGAAMFAGFTYRANTVALPALFSQNLHIMDFGLAVGIAMFTGTLAQYLGGRIADRYSLGWSYVAFHAASLPFLLFITLTSELPLVISASLFAFFALGMQPIENSLFADLTPDHWRSRAYGLKFTLTFGIGSTAVVMVRQVGDASGFIGVYQVLMGELKLSDLARGYFEKVCTMP